MTPVTTPGPPYLLWLASWVRKISRNRAQRKAIYKNSLLKIYGQIQFFTYLPINFVGQNAGWISETSFSEMLTRNWRTRFTFGLKPLARPAISRNTALSTPGARTYLCTPVSDEDFAAADHSLSEDRTSDSAKVRNAQPCRNCSTVNGNVWNISMEDNKNYFKMMMCWSVVQL